MAAGMLEHRRRIGRWRDEVELRMRDVAGLGSHDEANRDAVAMRMDGVVGHWRRAVGVARRRRGAPGAVTAARQGRLPCTHCCQTRPQEVVEVEEEVLVEQEEEVVMEQEEEKADEEMQECDDNEAGDKIGKDGKDEKEDRDEVLEEEEVVEAADDRIGNEMKDDKDGDEEMRVANGEEQSTEDGKRASQDKKDANMEEEQSMEDVKKASLDKEVDANMEEEQDTHMEKAATKKASAL